MKSTGWGSMDCGVCEPCPAPVESKVSVPQVDLHHKRRPENIRNRQTARRIDNCQENSKPTKKHHSQNKKSPEFMLDILDEMFTPEVEIAAASRWQEKDIAQLEASVIGVAKSQGIHPPRYNELSTCYADGEFQSDHAFDFWCRVAKLVRTHNHDECYLKYNEIHGSNVAHFYVAEHAMPHRRSDKDMDELFGEERSRPPQRPRHRRSF
jgi:hypothetical protein